MSKYPIFLDLASRRVVIIGGGNVALRKTQALLETGARLVVVADSVQDNLTGLCIDNKAELIKAKYSKDYLVGASLVIAATNYQKLNERIYKDCQQLEILCNVVDQPHVCDFYVPAVVKRGDLQIAISTDGKCPAFAGHLRKKLEKIFTEKSGKFLSELHRLRDNIINQIENPAERKILLGKLVDDKSFEFFAENGAENWRQYAEKIIKENT
ncbi:MAG: precorrin-2 dehydrogenase/sirohydrochlorin ferrochelatase family protein [Planctomycetota bacterium]|jgi:precorrin-2 dehydrogenase/sirohydrochlorin ferrochelatase